MNIRKLYCSGLVSLLVAMTHGISHAQSEATALFLTLPPGSRPNAMGTAHTAATDDFYALYFNPAGIARLQKGGAGFYHHNWLNNFPVTFTGAVYSTRYGSFGLAFNNFDLDFTSLGEELNSYERAFQLTYANRLSSKVLLGGSVKLVQEMFDTPSPAPEVSASAWGFDIGVLLQNVLPHWTYSRQHDAFPEMFRKFARQGSQGFSFGLALLNTGPDRFTFIDANQKDPLPQILRLGVAYNAVETDEVSLLLAFDLDKVLVERDADGQVHGFVESWFTSWGDGFDNLAFGGELGIYHIFAVRFGYDKFLNSNSSINRSDWTFGFGLGPEWARLNLVRRSFPTGAGNDKWVMDVVLSY